jgi:hypothetical protein
MNITVGRETMLDTIQPNSSFTELRDELSRRIHSKLNLQDHIKHRFGRQGGKHYGSYFPERSKSTIEKRDEKPEDNLMAFNRKFTGLTPTLNDAKI